MALFEIYPIVMAAVLRGNQWCRKRIVVYCDNAASVEIINKRRSKIPFIMKFVQKISVAPQADPEPTACLPASDLMMF